MKKSERINKKYAIALNKQINNLIEIIIILKNK